VVLTIAGFDPSSGAGVTADIKTIAAHDCYGLACISALTVQSTTGVRRVQAADPGWVSDTLDELSSDIPIAAIHIGMLGSAQVVQAVANFLERFSPQFPANASSGLGRIVLDPILKSTSGRDLLDGPGAKLLIERLAPLATVITPNLAEAAALTETDVSNLDEMRVAARRLHTIGSKAVVITGGHLDEAIDLLSLDTVRGIEQEVFRTNKLQSASTHGTGCAFSTSLACHLAMDRGLSEATLLAKTYVAAAISAGHALGRGLAPPHHLYRLANLRHPLSG